MAPILNGTVLFRLRAVPPLMAAPGKFNWVGYLATKTAIYHVPQGDPGQLRVPVAAQKRDRFSPFPVSPRWPEGAMYCEGF